MAVISDNQAKKIADGFTQIGGVNYYGGGNGEYNSFSKKLPVVQENKSSNVLSQATDIATTGIKAGLKFAADIPKNIYQGVENFGIQKVVTGELTRDLGNIKTQQEQLDQISEKYKELYTSGKMDKDQYVRLMKDIGNSYQDLSKTASGIATQADRGNVIEGALDTAFTILSAGQYRALAGAKSFRLTTPGATKALGQTLVKGGVTETRSKASRQAITELMDSQATKLDEIAQKIPAVRELAVRHAASLSKLGIKQAVNESSTAFITREARQLAIGMLLKEPLVYQLNVDMAEEVYDKLAEGNYGGSLGIAALQASQLVGGGIIGVGQRWIKKGITRLGEMSYGKQSWIDEVGKLLGKNLAEEHLALKATNPEAFKKQDELLRVFQATTMHAAGGDSIMAAKAFLANRIQNGEDLTKITLKELVDEAQNHYDAQQILKTIIARKPKNIDMTKLANAVIVRFDRTKKQQAVRLIIEAGDDTNAIQNVLFKSDEFANEAWNVNDSLHKAFVKAIQEGKSAQDIANKIKAIPTAVGRVGGLPKKEQEALSKLGYMLGTPTGGYRRSQYITFTEDVPRLVSGMVKNDEAAQAAFDVATAPKPQLEAFANALTKAGLSPQASTQRAFEALSTSVGNKLNELDIATNIGFTGKVTGAGDVKSGGEVILSKLQQYVDKIRAPKFANVLLAGKARPAITDIRQLTTQEIVEALSTAEKRITRREARAVKAAVRQGYLDTALEFRGLGDKLVDVAYRYNPAHSWYSRIQSALRYSYNPFFQTQEGFETLMFSGLQGGNRATNLATHRGNIFASRSELNATIKQLEDARVFGGRNAQGIFSSSLAGEAAQDVVLGRLTADITNAQKRDLAGLALDISNRYGMTVPEMIAKEPDVLADALRVVVQYKRTGFTASPLARTLNVAFFPVRYNIKVATLAADILAKQPPVVQTAIIHSTLNMKDWLRSDEGIKWQSDHADAIRVFNWISPLASINQVFDMLGWVGDKVTGNNNRAVGDMGMLGGLPFGIIGQVLDSQGIIQMNNPYLDIKTGATFPDWLPATTKARAATALADVLGSMFTYPGATLGLPGKSRLIRNAIKQAPILDASSADFDIRHYQNEDGTLTQLGKEKLTPMEKNILRVLGGDTSDAAIEALYMSSGTGFNWYTLPPAVLPFNTAQASAPLTKTQLLEAKAKEKAARSSSKTKNTAKPVGQF